MKRSLRSWLWRVPIDQEVDDELAFHLEMRTRELIARGIDPRSAREQAIRRMGDMAALKRTCVDLGRKRDREMRLTQWLEEFADDVTFAVRQLRGSPAFTAIAALTLALGIGANSAIFALVDATLLQPLPLPQSDRLVMLWERSEVEERSRVSPLNMLDWHERSRTFDAIGGFGLTVGGMVMSGADGSAETVPRQWVTARFFDALGVSALVGRTFSDEDDRQRTNAVVLNETFWRSRFNAAPSVVGTEIRLDGAPYTVVGVVPDEAQLLGRTSIWALASIPRHPAVRTAYSLGAIGRMKPGMDIETARADLSNVADALASELPKTNQGRGVGMEPLHNAIIGSDLRVTSMLFLGVVGFVLLICCANVANLLLARATVRARELAMRSALGAGRRRLIRQLITESLVLSSIGGALGIAVGAAILSAAPAFIPRDLLPAPVSLAFNLRVVLFCALTTITVGILFGLVPAFQATSTPVAETISAETRSVTGRGGFIRSVFVGAEIATAVLLLFGAGLLGRTLLAVENVDKGYGAASVLTMLVDPLGSRYPTAAALTQFYDDVEREVRALPGVASVAWTSGVPMGPSYNDPTFVEIVGDAPLPERERPSAQYQVVSPTYFEALDLPVIEGRAFTVHDTRDSTPVCIVSEAFARRHLRGRSPLGARVVLSPSSPNAKPVIREIVGVARQVKSRPDEREDALHVYVPMAQHLQDDIYLVVRPTSQRAEDLAGAVRGAIARIDKDQLVSVRDVQTLEDVAWDATARHRFRAVMVMTFAGLALVLAMVGVFGILAYSVQQRVRDIGLRRALGATSGDVLRLVLGSAARVIAAGVLVGLALSLAAGQLLSTMLFGVAPADPLTLLMVVTVLSVTALLSTAGPAWRAIRIDPASALRGPA